MFGLNLLQCKNLVDFYVGYNARKDGVGGMSWLFRRMIERLYMIMTEGEWRAGEVVGYCRRMIEQLDMMTIP